MSTASSGDLWESYLSATIKVALDRCEPEASWRVVYDKIRGYVGLPPEVIDSGSLSAFVLTAWNPMSKAHTMSENQARNADLVSDLERCGVKYLQARGESPDGAYFEDGFLIYGVGIDVALTLAKRYCQAAIYVLQPQTIICISVDRNRSEIMSKGLAP